MLTYLEAQWGEPIRVVAVPAAGLAEGIILENGTLTVALEPEGRLTITQADGSQESVTGWQVPVTWGGVVAVVVGEPPAAMPAMSAVTDTEDVDEAEEGEAESPGLPGTDQPGADVESATDRPAQDNGESTEPVPADDESNGEEDTSAPPTFANHTELDDLDAPITASALGLSLVDGASSAEEVDDDGSRDASAAASDEDPGTAGGATEAALADAPDPETTDGEPAAAGDDAAAEGMEQADVEPGAASDPEDVSTVEQADERPADADAQEADARESDETITVASPTTLAAMLAHHSASVPEPRFAFSTSSTRRGDVDHVAAGLLDLGHLGDLDTMTSGPAPEPSGEGANVSSDHEPVVEPVRDTEPVSVVELSTLLAQRATWPAQERPEDEDPDTTITGQTLAAMIRAEELAALGRPVAESSHDPEETVSVVRLAELLDAAVGRSAAQPGRLLGNHARQHGLPADTSAHITDPRAGLPAQPGADVGMSESEIEVMDATILGRFDPASLSMAGRGTPARTEPQHLPAANAATAVPAAHASAPVSAPQGRAQTAPGAVPGFTGPGLRISDEGGTREVPIDATLVLGRNPSLAQVRERDAVAVSVQPSGAGVSQTHVSVRVQSGTILVRDLWSTNGTRVKGFGVPPFRLRDGEEVPVSTGTLVELGDGVSLEIVAGGLVLGA